MTRRASASPGGPRRNRIARDGPLRAPKVGARRSKRRTRVPPHRPRRHGWSRQPRPAAAAIAGHSRLGWRQLPRLSLLPCRGACVARTRLALLSCRDSGGASPSPAVCKLLTRMSRHDRRDSRGMGWATGWAPARLAVHGLGRVRLRTRHGTTGGTAVEHGQPRPTQHAAARRHTPGTLRPGFGFEKACKHPDAPDGPRAHARSPRHAAPIDRHREDKRSQAGSRAAGSLLTWRAARLAAETADSTRLPATRQCPRGLESFHFDTPRGRRNRGPSLWGRAKSAPARARTSPPRRRRARGESGGRQPQGARVVRPPPPGELEIGAPGRNRRPRPRAPALPSAPGRPGLPRAASPTAAHPPHPFCASLTLSLV